MDTKIEEEIGRLEKIVEEKFNTFNEEKDLLSVKIHEIQKDIDQGRSKTPRVELYKHQDDIKKEIKSLTHSFMSDRDSIYSKITRLEETKKKIEDNLSLIHI